MAKFKDYYAIMNLPPFSEMETVKSAYRKLVRQYHPDLNPNNKAAEDKFKEIAEAYGVLSNAEKKRAYDNSFRMLRQARGGTGQAKASARKAAQQKKSSEKATRPRPSPKPRTEDAAKKKSAEADKGGSSTPINELFETFLKRGFSGSDKDGGDSRKKEKPRRGEDVSVETVISPQEADEGTVKTVNVQHREICRRCTGTGKLNGAACPECGGKKTQVRTKKIDVRIPANVKTGSKVRVAGEGGRGWGGGEDGDLFLNIKVEVDDSLRVEGLNVYCDFNISVTDAVLGTEVDVPTLAGSVKMTVPAGTSSGKVFRLKEAGAKNGSTQGDQFVTVHIRTPKNLSPREKELYEELARLRSDTSPGEG